MSTSPRFRVALAGCGHVAARYAEQMRKYPRIELVGVASRRPERAKEFARAQGLQAYASLAELVADPRVDIVVNLTPAAAHAAVTERCLRSGKHVHSEKPLALSHPEARRLAALAGRVKRRLSSAPATFLGEAQQTVGKILRDGRLGRIRVVYAEVNQGRIERRHPAPDSFFRTGVLWDAAVYPLAILTAFMGPVRRVSSLSRLVLPERVTPGGRVFRIKKPDFVLAMLEFADGPVARLTANFCVERDTSKGGGSIEWQGDAGRLFLGDFQSFDAAVEWGAGGERYVGVPLVRPPFPGIELGRGVLELADSLGEDRPHRTSAEHAAHVVEIVAAIEGSMAKNGRPVAVRSSFPPPAPMPWAQPGTRRFAVPPRSV